MKVNGATRSKNRIRQLIQETACKNAFLFMLKQLNKTMATVIRQSSHVANRDIWFCRKWVCWSRLKRRTDFSCILLRAFPFNFTTWKYKYKRNIVFFLQILQFNSGHVQGFFLFVFSFVALLALTECKWHLTSWFLPRSGSERLRMAIWNLYTLIDMWWNITQAGQITLDISCFSLGGFHSLGTWPRQANPITCEWAWFDFFSRWKYLPSVALDRSSGPVVCSEYRKRGGWSALKVQ